MCGAMCDAMCGVMCDVMCDAKLFSAVFVVLAKSGLLRSLCAFRSCIG
jgi:hypothetical protein